jgi:hypothetical protein
MLCVIGRSVQSKKNALCGDYICFSVFDLVGPNFLQFDMGDFQ